MWVSKKEIADAKQYDVYSYLRLADPGELVKTSAGEYRLRSHDSFVISNGMWHWYSRNMGGRSAIDYLVKVKNYEFPQAVKEVNRVMKGTCPSVFLPRSKEKKLRLPGKCEDTGIVKAYLLFRGLDEKLIDWLIDNEMLYESCEHHSAVFVGHDADGNPAHGAYRSTDNSGFKGDYSGSNKRFCFRLEREKCSEVYVFESAIDLLSFVTFMIEDGFDCSMKSFISTAGISAPNNPDDMKTPAALDEFLNRHPETDHVFLCFDSDEVGRASAMALMKTLEGRCAVTVFFPRMGKDWNEYLMIERKEKNCGEN